MSAQQLRRLLAVPGHHRGHDPAMLRERNVHPVTHPQLKPPVGLQAPVKRRRLLGEESVVSRLVKAAMECLVVLVVQIAISCSPRGFAGLMRPLECR